MKKAMRLNEFDPVVTEYEGQVTTGFPTKDIADSFCKYGSAQEFVETRILGGFLKNDEFGLGDRHALRLE